MAKKKQIFLPAIFIILAFALVSVSVAIFSLSPKTSVENEISEKISVPSGATMRTVARSLKEKNLIRSENAFYVASRFASKKGFVLKSGVYTIKSTMDTSEILELLSSGVQEYIKVSIPEGLTISKIAEILSDNGICSAEKFILETRNPELLAEYNIPFESFEGCLFPDTYFFVNEMSETLVIRKMADNFFEKIGEIEKFKNQTQEEFFENIVLASIVEREYRVEEEAPLIASVFRNRMKVGSGLYSCATIEYIITEIQGRAHPDIISYDDLKIDSPYNTYKWAALPPSPISNPGLVALNAVADTPKTNYFYFTLTDVEKGSHTFTKDFVSHKLATKTYKRN